MTAPIKGLIYIKDFVRDSQHLINFVDRQPWMTALVRRVQHYGYRYDYRARSVTKEMFLGPLPSLFQQIAQQLFDAALFRSMPDQVIVNEYFPGQGISVHVDCIPCFGPVIATLSLGSRCEMEFSHLASAAKYKQILEENSLLVLSDEARYKWRHAIQPRIFDDGVMRNRRISITFRTVIFS